jgi:hypothetical protein
MQPDIDPFTTQLPSLSSSATPLSEASQQMMRDQADYLEKAQGEPNPGFSEHGRRDDALFSSAS